MEKELKSPEEKAEMPKKATPVQKVKVIKKTTPKQVVKKITLKKDEAPAVVTQVVLNPQEAVVQKTATPQVAPQKAVEPKPVAPRVVAPKLDTTVSASDARTEAAVQQKAGRPHHDGARLRGCGVPRERNRPWRL